MDLTGVLFFPVTPFGPDGAVNLDALGRHVDDGLAHRPGAVFSACGTGELHALSADEHRDVVAATCRAVAGRVPVLAGAGGPVPVAVEHARAARAAGADGLLLLPPYLVAGPPDGLVRYVETVAAATDLPLVVYQRGNTRFTPQAAAAVAAIPGVVGFKDGLGDMDHMQRIITAVRAAVGERIMFFNGLPTAEVTVPAFRGIGVHRYSSAVFCFLPEVAVAFYEAVTSGDAKTVDALLQQFYVPLVELRDTVPGYAVSLVKAGVRLRGLDVGGVRPPLCDPSAEHVTALEDLVRRGLAVVSSS